MSPEQHDAVEPIDGEGWRIRLHNNRRTIELTAFIIVICLLNLFWSQHTADVARAQAEHATRVAAAAQSRALVETNRALHSSCDFYHDLAGLPPSPVATGKPPTKLGVSIIVHSRLAFRGDHCAGTIPPASPALARWARYYHLPVS